MARHVRTFLGVCLLLATAAPLQAQDSMRTGTAAFGDWQSDAPGVTRLIRPDDLGPPFAGRPGTDVAQVVKRPGNAMPKVPAGFRISLFADRLQEPRKIVVAPNGDIIVAESTSGRVVVLRPAADGSSVARKSVFAADLDLPYGLAFWPPGPNPTQLYVGEDSRVVRFAYQAGDLTARGPAEPVIEGLPEGGHWTRDVAFSPDGQKLFIAVGSLSNIGKENADEPPEDLKAFEQAHARGASWGDEEGRASLWVANADGSGRALFATGLRNCGGLTVQPGSGTPWCTVNERDGLGDNLPPDYATPVRQGGFYGWPWFYIGPHAEPRIEQKRDDLAADITVPSVLIQPHSAPLGITFDEGGAFGADLKGSAFVALHGSWNRGKRTGYKIVRLLMQDGRPTGAYQDFVTGFVLPDGTVWGRPVGVAIDKQGGLLLSEDANGTIWRVTRAR